MAYVPFDARPPKFLSGLLKAVPGTTQSRRARRRWELGNCVSVLQGGEGPVLHDNRVIVAVELDRHVDRRNGRGDHLAPECGSSFEPALLIDLANRNLAARRAALCPFKPREDRYYAVVF